MGALNPGLPVGHESLRGSSDGAGEWPWGSLSAQGRMREASSPCTPFPLCPLESAPLGNKSELLSSYCCFRDQPRVLEPVEEGQHCALLGQETPRPPSFTVGTTEDVTFARGCFFSIQASPGSSLTTPPALLLLAEANPDLRTICHFF